MAEISVKKLRGSRRLKVFQPARIIRGDVSERIHILDVSASGALAHGSTPPPLGASCIVALCGREHRARIVWVRANEFGLEFATPLSEDAICNILDDIATAGRSPETTKR